MSKKLVAGLFVSCLATGCASIVNGQNQSLTVETKQQGMAVGDAKCELKNNKGVWYVTTPGSVTVHRSFQDLAVKCDKENHQAGILTVKSSTKPMAFGNILFGGIIGVGVDAGTGAAYDYPKLITVEMGQTGTYTAPAPGPQASK